jgi:hypothetical protein
MRTPQIAIIAPQEPLPHLLFLLGPVMHHVMKPHNSLQPVPPKVPVEAVDDVLLRDIRNGGADIEEAACIGP